MMVETIPTTAAQPGPSAAPAPGKTIYTCPMHPEVQQDHPGALPQVRHDAGTEDGDGGRG